MKYPVNPEKKLDDFKWDNADKKEIQKLEKKYSSTDWNFKGTDC